MEGNIAAALDLVMAELVQHMEYTKTELEKQLQSRPTDTKNILWSAKYNGRRMSRLATAAQMLESLRKGF